MAKVTIIFDDTNPAIVAALGENVLNTLADSKGYTVEVHNPDYVPESGSPTIDDPAHIPPEGYDPVTYTWPQIDNPDYVAGVGNPTIPNPKSKGQFVAELAVKEVIVPWMFREREAVARRDVETQIKQVKDVVANSAEVIVE